MSKQSWFGKNCVLYLDRTWRPFATRTPEDTFVKMLGNHKRGEGVLPILMEFAQHEDGSYDFEHVINIVPVSVEEWMRRSPRDFDRTFNTINKAIVIPTVCVVEKYSHKIFENKVLKKVSKSRIGSAFGHKCAYTGKHVPGKLGNIDHIIPKSRGGTDDLENLVWCDKDINSRKADRTPEEAGLPQPRRLTELEYKNQLRNNFNIPEWDTWLAKK